MSRLKLELRFIKWPWWRHDSRRWSAEAKMKLSDFDGYVSRPRFTLMDIFEEPLPKSHLDHESLDRATTLLTVDFQATHDRIGDIVIQFWDVLANVRGWAAVEQ